MVQVKACVEAFQLFSRTGIHYFEKVTQTSYLGAELSTNDDSYLSSISYFPY